MEPALSADTDRLKVNAARGAFAKFVLMLPDDEVFAGAKQVSELLEHPGWVFLSELIDRQKAHVMQALVHGPLHVQAEYAAQLGIVSGMEYTQFAGRAVIEVARERERQLQAEVEQAAAEREGM
jgi:hypothetical protein